MNTILTDDERRQAIQSIVLTSPGTADQIARAVEAAVLAKLAQQEPVAEIEVNAAPAGGVTATVWSVRLAPGNYSLHLHPSTQRPTERFMKPFEHPEDAGLSKPERELAAMKRYIEKITKDKNSAVGFLTKAGIIDADGELAEHYRSLQSADAKPQEPVCVECDGTGRVSGSQSHFDCPECTHPAPAQADRQRVPEGWIALSDRRPEQEVYVLAWDGKKVSIDWWGSLPKPHGTEYTHWMPFPKPPGAGDRSMYGMHSLAAAPEAPAQNGHLADDERVAALCTLSYAAGMKAGWNYCASEDNEGFERSQKSVGEAIRILKAHRAAAEAPAQASAGDARDRELAAAYTNAQSQAPKHLGHIHGLRAVADLAAKEQP